MAKTLGERHYANSRREGRNTSVTSMDCPCKLNRERRAHRPGGFACKCRQARMKSGCAEFSFFKRNGLILTTGLVYNTEPNDLLHKPLNPRHAHLRSFFATTE